MNYLDLSDHSGYYNLAILIKPNGLYDTPLRRNYLEPMKDLGFNVDKTIALGLDYEGKKANKKLQTQCLKELMPAIEQQGIKYLLVCDSNYFKTLAGTNKAEGYHGYVKPCVLKGYEHINIVLGIHYSTFIYNPDMRSKLELSLKALVNHHAGEHEELGSNVFHSEHYPTAVNEIQKFLDSLHQYPVLNADIEAFSLRHLDAGIGTIAFSWDSHNGGGFAVDYKPHKPKKEKVWCTDDKKYKEKTTYGSQVKNSAVRAMLKQFLIDYKGVIRWHNITYDAYILIYQLFMDHVLDQQGMLEGMKIMLNKFDDTKIITYLATNTCAGNKLSLKEQAHEFLGNYAQEDIKNIRLIPLDTLLKYNLADCLGTDYTYKKRYPEMVKDCQEDVYIDVFKPSILDIIQMQLTGLCLDMKRVHEVNDILSSKRNEFLKIILSSELIDQVMESVNHRKWEKDFEDRKAKAVHPDKIKPKELTDFNEPFNPNSYGHLSLLLYEYMKLPHIDFTDSGNPATGADTLEKLLNHVDNEEDAKVLQALYDYSKVAKILSAFLPAFMDAPKAPDGYHYLFGFFTLGGTKSGRLSSNSVNLQQLPSTKSPYAKIIKSCFIAPEGWLFVGLDYNSLTLATSQSDLC